MKTFNIMVNIILMAALFMIVSCGEGGLGSSSPGDVVKISAINIADEDYDAFVALHVKKNGEELSKEEQNKIKALMPEVKKEMDKKGGLSEVLILDETVSEDGKTATVKTQLVYVNGEKSDEDTSELMMVNGEWKIIFDIGG